MKDEMTLGDVVKPRKGSGQKDIERIKNIILQKKLVIGRVPDDTKEQFVQFAKSEYCDDYGMAFKAIWEYFKGDMKYIHMLERIDSVEKRLNGVESKSDSKNIKTLGGKDIQVKK